jgi:glycosyltransferase involved in cell wall biosynthesis
VPSQAVPAVPIVLFANSPYMGGMEEHVLMLGRGLVRRGYRVGALCPPGDAVQPMRLSLAEAGVDVHVPAERQGRAGGALRRLGALVGILQRFPRCILHLHLTGHGGGSLVQLAGLLAGARAIVRTEHIPPIPPFSIGERLALWLRDRSLARIVCVSRETHREQLQRLGRDPHKCVVVPNCVDLERFALDTSAAPVRQELGLDPARPVIGTVSRLHETRKGIAHFLEMAATVARAYPLARFLVVGDGSLRSALEAQAAAQGIADQVTFTGERHDVPALLAAMDVFVMPSLYEGGPYTVLEAMAMAKPVVSTRVGLVPDAIQTDISGLVVPPGDTPALSAAVLRLLDDPQLAQRLARAGYEVVRRRFSLDAMLDGMIEVYRSVA